MKNIGFIGVGYMGYGIAKNILKHKNYLFVIANKNRKPINKIVNEGAEEVKSFEDFANKNLDALIMCVTNTPIAKSISEKISKAVPVAEKIRYASTGTEATMYSVRLARAVTGKKIIGKPIGKPIKFN